MSQQALSASLILTDRVVATFAGSFLHSRHTPSTVSCSQTGQCIVAKYCPIVPRGRLPPSTTCAGALLTRGRSLYLQWNRRKVYLQHSLPLEDASIREEYGGILNQREGLERSKYTHHCLTSTPSREKHLSSAGTSCFVM